MAIRKPGPGSSQTQISAYFKQELDKKRKKITPSPKRSVAKKVAKAARGGAKKSNKPAPKLS